MTVTTIRHRAAFAALMTVVFAGAAVAGIAQDETTIVARTTAGDIQKVIFEGELALGETRALTTSTGVAAVLTRHADGLQLEVSGERFDLPVDDTDALEVDTLAQEPGAQDGKRIVRILRGPDAADGDTNAQAGKRVVRVISHGENEAETAVDGDGKRIEKRIVMHHPGDAEHEALLLDDATLDDAVLDDPELMLAEGTGKRVLMLRRVHRASESTAQ